MESVFAHKTTALMSTERRKNCLADMYLRKTVALVPTAILLELSASVGFGDMTLFLEEISSEALDFRRTKQSSHSLWPHVGQVFPNAKPFFCSHLQQIQTFSPVGLGSRGSMLLLFVSPWISSSCNACPIT